MIEFSCTHCGKNIKTPDGSGGKRGKCPHCKYPLIVPKTAVDAVPAYAEPAFRAEPAIVEAVAIPSEQLPLASEQSPLASEQSIDAPPIIEPMRDAAAPAFDVEPDTSEPRPYDDGMNDWPSSAPPAALPRRRTPPRQKVSSNDIFMSIIDFRYLFSTVVIKAVWVIGTLLLTFGPPLMIIGGMLLESEIRFLSYEGMGAIFTTFCFVVVANVLWRLICESAILFFRMHEALEQLVDEARR